MKTRIYLVENCYGDPNKVYIGKTKTDKRHFEHRQKYGYQITFTIIEEIDSLDRKDWKPLESYWIEQFRQWGFEIQNIQKLGGSGVEFHTQETKDKISKTKKGHKCYENTEWKNKISRSLTGKKHPKGYNKGRIYSSETIHKMRLAALGKEKTELQKRNMRKPHPSANKPIIQYDLEMNFIKEWSSITEAATYLNKQGAAISESCTGLRKSSYKFIWKFKNS